MTDLDAFAREKGVKYFLVNFTDLRGVQRSKLVPAPAIAGVQKNGAGFAGFATYLDMSPADPDMFAVPDPDTVIQLPWNPEVAWVASDLVMDGKPVEQAPRRVLRRLLDQAAAKGFSMKAGIEAEYHLIDPSGQDISDPRDTDAKPCYDQSAVMRRYDVVSEICDAMIDLGWGPYQNDHEDANGQFEMNWDYADAMVTADRHAFFKFMVKSIAEEHGLRATFMPKPFAHLTGNGCHSHVSLWDESGANLFAGDDHPLGLSSMALAFVGGLMEHAEGICALTNPTVNSYKRINAAVTLSGATWSPSSITWTGNNRTHMIRVPDPGRFELRLPDGSANPYLLQAAILAAGLDGIEKGTDPGEPLTDVNMYTDGGSVEARKLPLYLIDAIRAFEADAGLKATLGEAFSGSYVKMKMAEWNEYSRHLTDWERQQTLDC